MADSEVTRRLVKARGDRSYAELASELGVGARTVRRWERSGRVPQRRRAALAELLGVTEQALFSADSPQPNATASPDGATVVTDGVEPAITITRQPGELPATALLLAPGHHIELCVEATITPEQPLTYQWFHGDNAIAEATTDRYTVTAGVEAETDPSGDYHVVVSASTSAEDSLSVQSAPVRVRLQLPAPTIRADSRQTARAVDVEIDAEGGLEPLKALIDHYLVDLDPRPAIFGLPRAVPAKPGGKAKVTIADVPLLERYRVLAQAVTKVHATPGAVAETSVMFAVGQGRWVTKTSAVWGLVALAAVAIGAISVLHADSIDEWALRFGIASVVVFVSVIFMFGWQRSALVGADGRLSTSKFQTALSTLAVGYALLVVMGVTFGADDLCVGQNPPRGCIAVEGGKKLNLNDLDFAQLIESDLTDDYLIMIGGPFTALVLARLSVGRKVRQGTIQKVDASGPSMGDAIADDNGRASLIDCQYLLFASLLVFYLVWKVTTAPEEGLPALPQTLVLLSSAAVVAYLGDKAVEDSELRITAISATEAAPGQNVEISGQNLVPAGATKRADGGLSVRLGSYAIRPTTVSSDLVAFDVPRDVAAGDHMVTVTTAAGQQENAGKLTVQRAPRLDGLSTSVAHEGEDLLVYGQRLTGFREPDTSPTVLFGTTASFGRLVASASGQALRVTVPALHNPGAEPTTETTVQLSVQPAGEAASRDTLPLRVRPTKAT